MTMKVNIKAISAFTIGNKGGNMAGLVQDADRFTSEEKQFIAAQAGFSETAFVSKSTAADLKLEFFTPVRQIAHCGHATIATFSYLKSQGLIAGATSSKETIDGTRRIFFEGDHAFMEQKPGIWSYNDNDTEIASALNVKPGQIVSAPVIVNTGNSFFLVEMESETSLRNVKPDFGNVTKISKKYHLIGFYLYVKTPKHDVVATTRMFAPLYGILEESATGMAAGPLAWWLYSQNPALGRNFRISQGELMETPSPSHLHVMLNRGGVPNIYVGGAGSLVREFDIDIPKTGQH